MRAFACFALSIVVASAANGQETATYTYDVHGRLIKVERSTGADTDYAYDDANNRTSKVTAGALLLRQQGEPTETSGTPPTDTNKNDNQGEEKSPPR